MRGLINHERDQRCHSYLKSAAECTSRAIVSLELSDEPVRSVKQARRLAGVGKQQVACVVFRHCLFSLDCFFFHFICFYVVFFSFFFFYRFQLLQVLIQAEIFISSLVFCQPHISSLWREIYVCCFERGKYVTEILILYSKILSVFYCQVSFSKRIASRYGTL